jgi:hypothetical protein
MVYAEDGCPAGFGNNHAKPNGEGSGESVTWPWPKANTVTHGCPRWASRITLEITEVRVQRLQEISESDAIAEGADVEFRTVVMRPDGGPDYHIRDSHRGGFANLWDNINGKLGYGWDKNPWVFALTFSVLASCVLMRPEAE